MISPLALFFLSNSGERRFRRGHRGGLAAPFYCILHILYNTHKFHSMNAPRHLTLRERIYEELVRMIVSGDLPSGAPIDERMLVERLAVSRTPFREAIGTLEKEGLVEIRPYRGFFVRSFSREQINDLYEL